MNRAIAIPGGFSVLVLAVALLAIPVIAQESGEQGNAAPQGATAKQQKQDRWEGIITRSDKAKKTLTVRQRSSGLEKYVAYDDSTEWMSQEHHGKPTPIDASQVQDNDRVICLGKYDKKGVLHATMISKRLSH